VAGCVFRVGGTSFDAKRFLAESSFRPIVVRSDGFNVEVSAGDTSFAEQVRLAVAFLLKHAPDLEHLRATRVTGIELDFGLWRNEGLVQSAAFPVELVELAARANVALKVSFYAASDA
jgi:hypothetical protein